MNNSKNRRGAVLVLMAVLLPVIITVAGFAINLAYMESVRTDIQIASDAASRAACRELSRSGDVAIAKQKAVDVVAANSISGKQLNLPTQDIVFGKSVRPDETSPYIFTAGAGPFNAVRVDLDSAASGGLIVPFRVGGQSHTFRPAQTATATRAELDVSLVVDRSGSMAYASNEIASPTANPINAPPGWTFGNPVPNPSRWLEAVGAVQVFLNELTASGASERVALTTYNEAALDDVQLTSNYATIMSALDVYTQSYQQGATNIGDGIGFGVNNLLTSPNRRDWAVRVLIVLTDGIHNWGPDPVGMTYYAVDKNVLVYTVTFAAEADQAKMQSVASIGGGTHYHATDSVSLKAVFQEIARNLPVLLTE